MWNNVDSCYNRNMTGKSLSMGHHFFIIIATILCIISSCTPIISDKRLCHDPDCSVVISSGKTVMNYNSNDREILSFHVNEDVQIYSKSAGSRLDLWGVEIAGKRGYAPSQFIKEKTIFHKDLEHEVPTPEYNHQVTESSSAVENQKDNIENTNIIDSTIITKVQPSTEASVEHTSESTVERVLPSFEVIDGTTFSLTPDEELKSDSAYATNSIHNTPLVTDQPVLTGLPNLTARDPMLNQHISPDTASSEINEQSSLQTQLHISSEEKVDIKSPDSVEPPEFVNNEQTMTLTDDKSTTINEDPHAVPTTERTIETPLENISNGEDFQVEKSDLENAEIVNANNSKMSMDLVNEIIQVEIESTPPAELGNVENSQEMTEQQNTTTVEENDERINTETITTESYSTTDILGKAFDTVTSLLDGLSITTQKPFVNEAIDERQTPNVNQVTDEIVQEMSDEEVKFVENESAEADKNNEDISQNNVLDEQDAQKAVNTNIIDNTASLLENNLINGAENIIDSAFEDISLNANEEASTHDEQPDIHEVTELQDQASNINVNEFAANRNLLNTKDDLLEDNLPVENEEKWATTFSGENVTPTDTPTISPSNSEEFEGDSNAHNIINKSADTNTVNTEHASDVCYSDNTCGHDGIVEKLSDEVNNVEETLFDDDSLSITGIENNQHYWELLSYLALTAITTLLFSLGYYWIENTRRDGQLIAKINKLEKELLISSKECTVLDETLKSTKTKLNSIEDQSFGSDEMVTCLKADLEAACKGKLELEDQVAVLEKDLESATEAGLELERMLREILASNNAENPLTKSVEDLQTRLNAQQSANESLTKALLVKTQENETLSQELTVTSHKYEQLEAELKRINGELQLMNKTKDDMEKSFSKKIEHLESQVTNISAERITLRKQLKGKEMEIKDLLEVAKQANISSIDFEKLSDVSRLKAEASQVLEEKVELQSKLNELEGAYNLLEEHMKIINEEMKSLTKQCANAEKDKQDAETRLQVLSKFFKEKEEERQKEEVMWMQQQNENSMTTERLQTVNNEIQSYKQQIETLKREILDQEREYKNQITNLEAKSHEQWVLARQSERRLEETKAEAAQLRNRLTLIEKNLNDNDSEVKTHRLETNGETATSPQLFIGTESSSSPIMFASPSNIPPPYLYRPLLPPFLPPHLHDVSQRPPPLGGRLSSPPPLPVTSAAPLPPSSGGRYEYSSSSPPSPPLSPTLRPPYGHYRTHPPPPHPPIPFPSERIHPPPVPLPSMLPSHLPSTSWGEDKMHSRNNGSFHPFQRDQQVRDYKGSFLPPEESLDKTHHSGKV